MDVNKSELAPVNMYDSTMHANPRIANAYICLRHRKK